MGDDADSHELFAVVAAVHHEGVGQTLYDRALSFAESLDGVAACGVRDVDWGADLYVIARKTMVLAQNLACALPISEGHVMSRRQVNLLHDCSFVRN